MGLFLNASFELHYPQKLLLQKLYGDDYESIDLDELTWRGELVPFRGTEVASFWPKHVEAAQAKATYRLIKDVPRIRYGDEAGIGDAADFLCHDCAAKRGEFHVPGCDMERCPECGKQLISCACNYDEDF